MFTKTKLPILALLVFGIFTRCSTSSTQSSHDTTIVNITFKKGKPLSSNMWHCYNVDQERICIPSSWRFINQTAYLFVANPTIVRSNSFFVVVKHNKLTSGFNSIKYLKEVYSEEKQDTTSKFIDQKVVKITYSDKESFYTESYSLTGGDSFTMYSTVFEIDNNLFDIALKIKSSQQKSYKEIYKDILFNFYYKNSLVFTGNDKIKKIEVVDLTKL